MVARTQSGLIDQLIPYAIAIPNDLGKGDGNYTSLLFVFKAMTHKQNTCTGGFSRGLTG